MRSSILRNRRGGAAGSRRGSALVVVLFTVLALAGVSAALISTNLFRYGAARGLHEGERAFQASWSAASLALYEMQVATDLTGDDIGVVTAGTLLGCDITASVDPAYSAPIGEYTLTASGRCEVSSRALEMVVTSDREFGFGMFADEGLVIGGSFMADSYDSSTGSYASQFFGDHAGDEGDLGSNWYIKTGAPVNGDATPGPGYQVLGDPTNVTGSTAPALFPVEIRSVVYQPVGTSAGTLNGSKAFGTGTYRYDALKMSIGTVTINGDVTLYIDGTFKMTASAAIKVTPGSTLTIHHGEGNFSLGGQGILNMDADPSSVMVVSSTEDKFKFTGGADFYGILYAPDADLVIDGGAGVFGVAVSNTATLLGTGSLHYDEALRVPDILDPPFSILSAYPVAP
jgi:hypothetical protein